MKSVHYLAQLRQAGWNAGVGVGGGRRGGLSRDVPWSLTTLTVINEASRNPLSSWLTDQCHPRSRPSHVTGTRGEGALRRSLWMFTMENKLSEWVGLLHHVGIWGHLHGENYLLNLFSPPPFVASYLCSKWVWTCSTPAFHGSNNIHNTHTRYVCNFTLLNFSRMTHATKATSDPYLEPRTLWSWLTKTFPMSLYVCYFTKHLKIKIRKL